MIRNLLLTVCFHSKQLTLASIRSRLLLQFFICSCRLLIRALILHLLCYSGCCCYWFVNWLWQLLNFCFFRQMLIGSFLLLSADRFVFFLLILCKFNLPVNLMWGYQLLQQFWLIFKIKKILLQTYFIRIITLINYQIDWRL